MARLFLSTDDNAPVITGADRTCLVNLLKKCLIEGYGTKAPVGGWTMPYSSADGRVGVFRNDHDHGGLGHYLRLGQDDDGVTNARYWGVQCYENMTDADNGLFPYTENPHAFVSSGSNDTVIRPWILLATTTWVMPIIYHSGTTFATRADANAANSAYATSGFWFGDIERWIPGDNYHSMFAGLSHENYDGFGASASSSFSSYYSSSSRYYYRFPRKSNGVGGAPLSHYCFVPHPQSGARFGAIGPEYSPTSALMVARACLNDGEPYTIRGWIPQMLVPLHPRPFEGLERVEINGKTYAAVCFSCGNTYSASNSFNCCQALFELDEGE